MIDFYLERYDDLFKQIIKWKVVPIVLLKEISDYQGVDSSFRKVISKLEKNKLLKTKTFGGKSKIVYPGDELNRIMTSPISVHTESLQHEAIVSIIANELLKTEILNDVLLSHEMNSSTFSDNLRRLPDACFEGEKNQSRFKLALEVELTQKSKMRFKNKIEDYISNRVFDYVLYIFNDASVFNNYKKTILEFSKEKGGKAANEVELRFILAFKKDILNKGINLDSLEVFYKNKNTTIEEIFGKRTAQSMRMTGT
jgi:hypothetical protein